MARTGPSRLRAPDQALSPAPTFSRPATPASQGQAPHVLSRTQIVDAGQRGAGAAGEAVGRVCLGSHDLRIPATGPPCTVVERPLERAPPPAGASARGHREAAPRRTEQQPPPPPLPPPTITLFLEKPGSASSVREEQPPSAAASVPRVESSHCLESGPENMETWMPARRDSRKLRLRIRGARRLVPAAKGLNVVVVVRACGREVGTTRVPTAGGTRSPDWLDEE